MGSARQSARAAFLHGCDRASYGGGFGLCCENVSGRLADFCLGFGIDFAILCDALRRRGRCRREGG